MSSGQAGQTPPSASSQGTPQPMTPGIGSGGVSEPIMASLNLGHPDFTGHLNRINQLQGQMSELSQEGPAYAQKMMTPLTGQLTAEKSALDAQMAPLTYAQKEEELNLMRNKPVAEEVSKQNVVLKEVASVQMLFDKMDKGLSQYYTHPNQYLGSANVAQATGGRKGSTYGARVLNQGRPLVAAINKVLTGRFNMGENEILSMSLAPSPNYTPKYNAMLMKDLHDMLKAMATGSQDSVRNVVTALNGQIPDMSGWTK